MPEPDGSHGTEVVPPPSMSSRGGQAEKDRQRGGS
jgi:hypothetical protein